jgi:hypothetical protein
MPGKRSEYRDAPWNDVASVAMRWTSTADRQRVLDVYQLSDPVVREDVKYITGDYLINNIELAFEVWRERPWGKHITFETFCEEILPYRVDTEPLENWREKVLASFSDIDILLRHPNMSAVEACITVNSVLPRFRLDKDFPTMSYSQLMASTRGPCANMAAFAAFVMRALGIPVTIDHVPRWITLPATHTWNTVCDSAGQHISFMGADSNPGQPHHGGDLLRAKSYRRTFSNSYAIRDKPENIPASLKGNMKDASADYENMARLRIPLKYKIDTHVNRVYLVQRDESGWMIAGYGSVKNDSIDFGTTGKGIVYLPAYYVNGTTISAGDPFLFNNEDSIFVLDPLSPDSTLVFDGIKPKATFEDTIYAARMKNGVFEGANKADFSDAKTLFVITESPKLRFNTVAINDTVSYRYVRYLTPVKGYGNVAEIEFYDANDKQIKGSRIGTRARETGVSSSDKVFDGNIYTFFDAPDKNAWTGLDLQTAKRIGQIRYCPRVDDGSRIYKGQTYETFYYTKNGWTSLGKQTAESNKLTLKVPRYALMYIDNVTTQMHGLEFFVSPKDNKLYWK